MQLVSILIPVYNAEAFVAEAIQSALNQTWPAKEIVVVDDGSSDQSREILKGFESAGIKLIEQENRGAVMDVGAGRSCLRVTPIGQIGRKRTSYRF